MTTKVAAPRALSSEQVCQRFPSSPARTICFQSSISLGVNRLTQPKSRNATRPSGRNR